MNILYFKQDDKIYTIFRIKEIHKILTRVGYTVIFLKGMKWIKKTQI